MNTSRAAAIFSSVHYVTQATDGMAPARPASSPDLSGLRERTHYLLERAYQNLYGLNLPAEPDYQQPLFNAALQLMQDSRSRALTDKLLLKAFEDIIRISDEHTREARRHLSRASNPVYLRETALDNVLAHQHYAQHHAAAPVSQLSGAQLQHTGRMSAQSAATHEPSELLEAACSHLAASIQHS